MEFLVVMLIIVLAVVLADVIAHFIPAVPAPIMQIALGAAISFIPMAHHFEVEHHYFHLLFIAPLAYFGGMEINRRELWKSKGAIANFALLLILITGVAVGPLIHAMIPAISIIASITLMSALGPTDHVAVDTVEKHSHIPHGIMELLKNESVFAEVTAVIFLQTCVGVAGGEHITAGHVTIEFVRLLLGGIGIGLALGIAKLLVVRLMYTNGIKHTALHTLIGVAFPFFAFILSEHLEVSGIVAIFVAGIVSTFEYKEGHADVKRLEEGAEHVWDFLAYTLDGFIFVMLGMYIPEIIEKLVTNELEISPGYAIVVILIVSGAILGVRFLWALLTLPKRTYEHDNISRGKAAGLFTMSGARGAITWASVESIPVVLASGIEFPHRELILTIAMGVIICSVILSYVVLPIIAPKQKSVEDQDSFKKIHMEILSGVADTLVAESTVKNREEINLIAFRYRDRADDIQMTMKKGAITNDDIDSINRKIIDWKIENLESMEKEGQITSEEADYFIKTLDRNRRKKATRSVTASAIAGFFNSRKLEREADKVGRGDSDVFLRGSKANAEYVLSKLEELKKTDNSEVIEAAIQKYRFNLSEIQKNMDKNEGAPINDDVLASVERRAVEIETGLIQDEFEKGNLSFAESKAMKSDIAMLAAHLV